MVDWKQEYIKVRTGLIRILGLSFYPVVIIIGILLIVSIVSNLSLDTSNDGFDTIFKQFNSSIKLGTAFLAIAAIILTIERMRQTRAQIEAIDHNYRFNNFYKHKDEFIKAFSIKKLYNDIAKQSSIPIESILSDIYQFYFYKSYHDFTLEINPKSEFFINNYYKKLNSLDYNSNTSDFNEIFIEEISEISNSFTEHHIVISGYVKACLEKEPLSTIHSHTMGEEFEMLLHLCKIYYTCQIIIDVVSFANIPTINYNISPFATNFHNYLQKHNLQNCFFLFQ